MKKLYQQGDLLLFEVDEIPLDSELVSQGQHQNILLRGEATGHAHRVDGFMEMYRKAQGGGDFMRVPKRIVLIHDEHDRQEIPPGTYLLGRVREMDHIAQEARRVQD